MNKKVIDLKVKPEERIKLILKALNGFLNLTSKELEVVAHFLDLNPNYPCGTKERKEVCDRMDLKTVQNLNNIIRSISSKKVFINTGNGYMYNALIQNIDKLNKILINIENV